MNNAHFFTFLLLFVAHLLVPTFFHRLLQIDLTDRLLWFWFPLGNKFENPAFHRSSAF